jgi:hypothetical protein
MEQCDEREKTQVNNLHLGRDLSRVSDFVHEKSRWNNLYWFRLTIGLPKSKIKVAAH